MIQGAPRGERHAHWYRLSLRRMATQRHRKICIRVESPGLAMVSEPFTFSVDLGGLVSTDHIVSFQARGARTKIKSRGASLDVQWLRIQASTAGTSPGFPPWLGN